MGAIKIYLETGGITKGFETTLRMMLEIMGLQMETLELLAEVGIGDPSVRMVLEAYVAAYREVLDAHGVSTPV